jgi:hypothetical protein
MGTLTMNRVLSLIAGLSLVSAPLAGAESAAPLSITLEGKAGVGVGKHIVLLAGDEEYRSEESMPMMARLLQRHGFKCTVLFSVNDKGEVDPDSAASVTNPEAMDSADLIIMALRFRNWPEAAMAKFDAAVRRGVPLVALRTSTHAFKISEGPWKHYTDFGENVLGEEWVTHWGHHKVEATRGVIEPSAKDHPVLRGVTDVFGNSDVYEAYPPADATILLRGAVLTGMNATDPLATSVKKRVTDKAEQPINEPMMPVAWSREVKNGGVTTNRVVTTTMGSATDLANEGLRRFVFNSVCWGLKLEAPADPKLALPEGWTPTMYGFKGGQKARKPLDFLPKE